MPTRTAVESAPAVPSVFAAPYRPIGREPIVPGPAEDPSAWYGQGAFHLIYSRKFTDPRHLGATASSVDGRHWTPGAPLFGLTLHRQDGRSQPLARRERAHLVRTGPRSWLLLTAIEPSPTSDRTEIVATRVSTPTT